MKKQSGFTLLEIMVVVVIMGMLSSVVAVNLMGAKDQAAIQTAGTKISDLGAVLETYRLDTNQYPTTDQGLDALIRKPTSAPVPKRYRKGGYLQEMPLDPWGNEFIYMRPGIHNPDRYDLYSAGPDGEPDTNDDIGNWKGADSE